MPNRTDIALPAKPEDELLRLCCRTSPSPEQVDRIHQLINSPLDWERVLERSWWHRIRPLTYRRLAAESGGRIPAPLLQRLAEQASELKARNERLRQGLEDVGGVFEQAGLRLIVFKGPTLAIDAYGDLSWRECGDLDLLLHREDFAAAADLLKSHGFECCWDRDDEAAVRQVFACEFDRDNVRLDVHWDLAPGWFNYRVDFDRCWQHGEPLSADFDRVRKMRAEEALVVLCMHGAKHWWERLRWIADIAELVDRGSIRDWDRLEADAAAARSRRTLELGLWLASRLLGARLPAEIDRRVSDRRVNRLGRQVADWLDRAEGAGMKRSLKDRFMFRMGLCERWQDRVPQIWRYFCERPVPARLPPHGAAK